MALTTDGLTVQTFQEVLETIVTEEQENVSSQIDVSDDTALGQTNQIIANQIALANQGIQDVYDQRNIFNAEGKALDDNVTWLGITRQDSAATTGEALFTGNNGATIVGGSLVQNDSTGDNYTVDNTFTLTSNLARAFNFKVISLASGTYSVSIQGILYSFVATVPTHTEFDILTDLIGQIDNPSEDLNASIPGGDEAADTTAVITTGELDGTLVDSYNLLASVSENQTISEVTTASNITGVVTGSLSASANSIVNILTPFGGWTSVNNPVQLTIGRDQETDIELRTRAIGFSTSTGTATVKAMTSAILQVSGVSSVSLNEQFVSDFVGDTQLTIAFSDGYDYQINVNGDIAVFTGVTDINTTTAGLVAAMDLFSSPFYSATDNVDGTITISSGVLYKIAVVDVSPVSPQSFTVINEGQHAGSIQLVIAGGGGNEDEIAQTIYDTKPAGVEIWALDTVPGGSPSTGVAIDYQGQLVNPPIEWNSPTDVTMFVTITYHIFNQSLYPDDQQDAFAAIRASMVLAGNALGAGSPVSAAELEYTVYAAVSGISNVVINITSSKGDSTSVPPLTTIILDSDEQALFIDSESDFDIDDSV